MLMLHRIGNICLSNMITLLYYDKNSKILSLIIKTSCNFKVIND